MLRVTRTTTCASGATSRLDNLQAALLSVKLPHLDGWNEQRREAAALYREALAGLPLELPPEDPSGGGQVFHLFAVEVDDRDRVREALGEAGVGAAVHYPRPAHLNPAWSELGSRGDLPAAERLADRTLSLPMFPGITRRGDRARRRGAARRARVGSENGGWVGGASWSRSPV